ncbi:MAG: hypothetical protein LBC85_07815 [Fibromonadaceae bacterium]|jgi:hypothetical protein|nr:hypothetical protein [Fibromonadaceae bacterium]
MKKQIFTFFATCSLVFATEELQQTIDNRVEAINARKGIEIGGTVRSASFNSHFKSPNEAPLSSGMYVNALPDREIAEFVQLDLDFRFRPWDIIGANLKLRLGAGSQEFFAAAATTVNSPWMNIEGNIDNWFYWVVGDFRQAYSPLTLYVPGLDIMYEPMVFARKREVAQKEALLEGNQRNLQGFNLQFRPQFGDALGELRVEALGARLRRAGYLDAGGAMGNMLPNEGIPGATQAARFDKFLLGGNIELLPFNKNLLFGATYLAIFDDKKTADFYCSDPDNPECHGVVNDYLGTLDSEAQKTTVLAGRVGADIAGIMKANALVADLVGEFAVSDDKELDKGNAILAQLDLGYKSDVKVVLSSSFIRNDAEWFNNVAQTPSFFARRILNSDKDGNLSKYGVYAPLYSTFDALYFFTPKHSPMPSTPFNSPGAGTQSYQVAPYAKNSWNAATLTRAELALLQELSDLNLQMALPNGFATSNRQGFQEVLTASWKGLAEVKGLFANFEQLSAPSEEANTAKYTEFGVGAKVNVLGIFGFELNPLELSGSYKHSAKEQEWNNDLGKAEYTSDFINAGLYYRFYRRFGLTFGYQQINSELNLAGADIQKTIDFKAKIVPIVESVQNQWMVGLDYTVAPNAWLSINYGRMKVSNTYDMRDYVEGINRITGTNLPDYIAAGGVEAGTERLKHEFSRNILEATINVEF